MNKIGIIGYGNMGSAIAEGIKDFYDVAVFDKDKAKTKITAKIKIANNIAELVVQSEIIILAVKPQDFDGVLSEIKNRIRAKLLISIAAGITTRHIEQILRGIRVIRVMPNLGARIGKSVTCLCKGRFASDGDLKEAKDLFSRIGKVQDLNEGQMDAATAISGSGPAYYFHAVDLRPEEYKTNHKKFHEDFILALTEAAQSVGFDIETAKFLAHWTIVFSDLLLKETKLSASELKKQVTSKGGTTEAALEVLHRGGSLVEAVKAAVRRAKELSKD